MAWAGTAPAWYAECTHSTRNGVFYQNEAPNVSLSQLTPTTYQVFDFYGNTVSSGNVTSTVLTPTAPAGGWSCGWYRLYLYGPNTDAVYGNSYGGTNFIVIPVDSRFVRPATTDGAFGSTGSEGQDPCLKGWLGMGLSRFQVGDATAPTTTGDSISNCVNGGAVATNFWSNPTNTAYLDSARPRRLFMQFPNGGVDLIALNNSGGTGWLHVYPLDRSFTWNNLFVSVAAGTSTGYKVTVAYPDAATVVETYDNLLSGNAAVTAINAASTHVKVFTQSSGAIPVFTTKQFSDAHRLGVIQTVQALYPQYKAFEGASNEFNAKNFGPESAWRQKWFQDAVHAGNASAVAIGPCFVDIESSTWTGFISNGGLAYCDEVSTHAYNSQTNGDFNLGKNKIPAWLTQLSDAGYSGSIWITESTNVFSSVYGVYHPRRGRVVMQNTLQWEQYGVPREQNLVWYDLWHGFLGYPAFAAHISGGQDKSLNAYPGMYRTLVAETFGMTYNSALDFKTDMANGIFLGSLYTSASKDCVVLVSSSHIDNATVDLQLGSTTTQNLILVDAWGNQSTVTAIHGRVKIPVNEIPCYLRLPAGSTVSVATCFDWPDVQGGSISSTSTTRTVGGLTATAIADGGFMTDYATLTGVWKSSASPPEDAVVLFPSTSTISGVVVFCGGAWQNLSAFVDFDVNLTTDGGSTWTTVATVTKSTPASVQHGTSAKNAFCIQETFWDEQCIFPVSFAAQSANGVQIHVRSTSYGGEPDSAAILSGGQGASAQHVTLQEIAVLPASASAAFTYQWQRNGVNIGGATSSTYTTQAADSGKSISCVVTDTNDGGTTSQASNSLVITNPQSLTIPILSS